MKISIIIPAHNEEEYIEICIKSILKSAKLIKNQIEIIVVLNRCNDNTENICKQYKIKTIKNNFKNLSKIRNHWIKSSSWKLIITIDADNIISENMLPEIIKQVKTKKIIGWWVLIKPERNSPWIFFTNIFLKFYLSIRWISAGLFWFKRKYFDKIWWFNEKLLIIEDLDFAIRLKKYANKIWKKYKTIKKAYIITSCRKFDYYWDWHWFRFILLKPIKSIKILKWKDKKFINKYFYLFNNKNK